MDYQSMQLPSFTTFSAYEPQSMLPPCTVPPTQLPTMSPPSISEVDITVDYKRDIDVGQPIRSNPRSNPLNDAYAKLQAVIPHVDRKPKIPKIKTLRCACKYIEILREALNDGTTRCVDYYREKSRTAIESEVQSRNNYKARADEIIKREKTADGSKWA